MAQAPRDDDAAAAAQTPLDLVLIGGGPRATLVLERLSATAETCAAARGRPVRIHVVEPYDPGSGRIWRRDQSRLLKLNSMARDVTMFTDDTVEALGAPWDGPSLDVWAAGVADGSIEDVRIDDEDDLARIRALRGTDFPTRRVQYHYLSWVWRRVAERLEATPGVAGLTVHRTMVSDLSEAVDGGWDLELDDGRQLHADAAVLLLGHTDDTATRAERTRAEHAQAAQGSYQRPGFTTDLDWSALGPGERVLATGMGLGFIDLMVLLYEDRGGRFRTRDGRADLSAIESGEPLVYEPSGQEPLLWVGSRRGVPFHSKISVGLKAPFDPQGLRFATPAGIAALLDDVAEITWDDHLWPLMRRETAWHWYREIFLGHPERVSEGWDWDRFSTRLAEADAAEVSGLAHAALRDSSDVLDLHAVDRPLEGLTFENADEVQDAVLGHIRRDLAQRSDPEQSQTLALFLALLYLRVALIDLLPQDRLSFEAVRRMEGWWPGFFSFVDSGPPAHRLQELLALHEAGLVRFLGPDTVVERDAASGQFRGRSRAGGPWVTAPHFVEARLPGPSVSATADPVLRAVGASGVGEERSYPDPEGHGTFLTGRLETDARGHVLGPDGRVHSRLLASGVFTTVTSLGAFARPRQNSEPFRSSDALAVELWKVLGDVPGASQHSGASWVI